MGDAQSCWNDFDKLTRCIIQKKENENHLLIHNTIPFQCIECSSEELRYDQTSDETTCLYCCLVQPFNCSFFRGNNEYLPDTSVKITRSMYKYKDYLLRKLDELSCARIIISEELMGEIIITLKDRKATVPVLKKILFEMGHKQKYLQIPTILYTLYPEEYPPLTLSCRENKHVTNYFLKYIDAFHIVNNNRRKNLLNYNYVLMKIFIMLDIEIKDHYFIIPKGKKTIASHDEMWLDICKYNKWY